ncbi:MAG TPA: N-carbamoyl-D-amino-acid hydrolase [Acidimicrobiales bacterium]|nr:N-carbamoyl-D-amino-acid hydrolase [Acidimicrobiales bacterium]
MTRVLKIGAAQLGPIQRDDNRKEVVERLIALLNKGAADSCDLVVFPELALTTFFPRWWSENIAEFDHFFETEMPSREVQPLFDEAKKLRIGFHLGYAEMTPDGHRYNTSILVSKNGEVLGKYRKVHLPGHEEHEPWRTFQHLERYYFEPGNEFKVFGAFDGVVGMAICNDRRWSETYRVLGLQGCELALIGYNTPVHYPPDPSQDALAGFHNHLVMQSGAYQNGMWVVGVAKAGNEEGCDLLGESSIIAPSGEIVAQCSTVEDELVSAVADLDMCANYKDTLFDFDRYRRPEVYKAITSQVGIEIPEGIGVGKQDDGCLED